MRRSIRERRLDRPNHPAEHHCHCNSPQTNARRFIAVAKMAQLISFGYGRARKTGRSDVRNKNNRRCAMETSYGFKDVAAGEKQGLVNEVFHRVAKRYDIMNDLMSGGMHRLWKDAMVTWLNPPKRDGWRVLDVAGGTGDISFRIVEASQGHAHATVLDVNGSMLAVGQERAVKRGAGRQSRFRRGQC
jgi:2-polyprenyl-3-methyl-5-hydroxy-6-metoxy-1,4-benzoquinol methylase